MTAQTQQNLLDVKDLTVSFGGKPVVHGINFSIKAGERIALVGESGSGKTVTALSLLRLVMNAELRGTATFANTDRDAAVDLLSIPEQQLRGIRPRHRHDLSRADDGAKPAFYGGRSNNRNFRAKNTLKYGASRRITCFKSYTFNSYHRYF